MYAGQQRKRFWPAFVLGCNAAPATPNPATLRPATQRPSNPATQRPSDPATRQSSDSVPSDPATQRPRNPAPCNPATLQPSTLHPTPFVFGGPSPAFRRLMPEIPQIATSKPAIEPNRVAICPKPCRLFPIRGLLPGRRGALRRILAKTWHRVRKTWQRRRLDSLSRPCGATAPMRGRARSPREAAAPALGPALIVSATWML